MVDLQNGTEDVEENVETHYTPPLESLEKFNMIDIGSYVAVYASSASWKHFHVIKVLEKGVADQHMRDPANDDNCVLRGEHYILGKWFSLQKQATKFAYYKEATHVEECLVNIAQIFYTDLNIIESSKLPMSDFNLLCCNM